MSLIQRPRPPSRQRRARGAHAHHQRQPACQVRQGAGGDRREAPQRLDGHARQGQVPRADPLGRSRPGDARHRCRPGRRPAHQDQRGGAARRQRHGIRRADPLEPRPRHGPHPDRGHADGRDRRRGAARPVPAAVAGPRRDRQALHARPRPTTAPAGRRATSRSRRPAGGWASSRRSPTISAKAAIACGSPAPARSTCASARRTPPICARPLRASESDELLDQAITEAIARKPKGHDFIIDRRHNGPAVPRHMSVTGG